MSDIGASARPRSSFRSWLGSWAGRAELFPLWLAITFLSIFALARQTALTFPYPWNDEARFYLPSWWFSHAASLKPDILHAPQGIFWTPHGFYVFLGSILALVGDSIVTARTINQLLVALAACVLVIAHRRLTGSTAFATLSALLLISPPVILAANEVRMESMILLLYAASILLVCSNQPVAAIALLVLSLLVHPALLIATVIFFAVLVFRGIKVPAVDILKSLRATPLWSWLLLVLVLAAVLLEAIFVRRHYGLFRANMAYQSARKLERTLGGTLLKPQGMILLLECAGLAACRWRSRNGHQGARRRPARQAKRILAQVAAIAIGLQIYAVWGAEFQYDVYSVAFAPATCFCIAYRLLVPGEGLCPLPSGFRPSPGQARTASTSPAVPVAASTRA